MENVKSRIVKNVLEATLEPMTKLKFFFWADHYNTCLDPLVFKKTQLYGFQNEDTNSRPSTSHEEAEKHECLQPFPLILSSKRTHFLKYSIFFVHLLLVKFHVNLNKTVSNYVLTFFVWWILKWLELVLSGGHCH